MLLRRCWSAHLPPRSLHKALVAVWEAALVPVLPVLVPQALVQAAVVQAVRAPALEVVAAIIQPQEVVKQQG